MNGVFMSVDVTYYDHGLEPFCRFYEILDNGPCSSRKLSIDEAHKLAWELMLAGGEREYRTNYNCNHIHTVTVRYWARR